MLQLTQRDIFIIIGKFSTQVGTIQTIHIFWRRTDVQKSDPTKSKDKIVIVELSLKFFIVFIINFKVPINIINMIVT